MPIKTTVSAKGKEKAAKAPRKIGLNPPPNIGLRRLKLATGIPNN